MGYGPATSASLKSLSSAPCEAAIVYSSRSLMFRIKRLLNH
jgi:hypothetical protein